MFCPVGFPLAPLRNGHLGRSWVLGRFWVSGRRGLVWASSCLVWAGLGFWPVCGLLWAGSGLIWGAFRPAPDRPRPDPSLFAHMLAVKPLVRHTGRREIKKTSGSTQTPVTYDPYYYNASSFYRPRCFSFHVTSKHRCLQNNNTQTAWTAEARPSNRPSASGGGVGAGVTRSRSTACGGRTAS